MGDLVVSEGAGIKGHTPHGQKDTITAGTAALWQDRLVRADPVHNGRPMRAVLDGLIGEGEWWWSRWWVRSYSLFVKSPARQGNREKATVACGPVGIVCFFFWAESGSLTAWSYGAKARPHRLRGSRTRGGRRDEN